MASSYSDLKIELIATGEQSGSWGTTTNTNLGTALEEAIVGTVDVAFSSGAVTLSLSNSNATQSARHLRLNLTGTSGGAQNLIVPAIQKNYLVHNGTANTITVKTPSGTGIGVPSGKTMWVYNNGTNVVDAVTAVSSLQSDGGVTVDNITIDGTEIDLSSGNLLIDVAGDLTLDADGGNISFDDAGTEIGRINMDSSNLTLRSTVSDKDVVIQGNDGGANISALTLDMSAAGAATFNSSVTATAVTANGGVTVDNITIDGTEIDLSSGDLTLDVAGDIILDADGAQIRFKDAGTERFTFNLDATPELDVAGGTFTIHNTTSDADILLVGNDGGSAVTALTLDMSAAGAATFNNDVTAFSDERLKDNIETIPDALDKVCQMRGVTFNRTDFNGEKQMGVIAQEVEKVIPEVVREDDSEDKIKSVAYGNMVGVLIEAIKDLKAEVDELKKGK
jgi:hypothetical protein|tara:strand:+ start:849 stop:2198 length:1350 start_codon:yes stop_codon:yes gene_type:complete